MVQKDSSHTGAVQEGPEAPLKRLWLATSGDRNDSFTTWPVVKGGVVYASSGPGVLAAEAGTGRRLWFYRPPEGQKQVAPAVDDRALYLPLPRSQVVALDRVSGAELWRARTEESSLLDPSPTLAGGRLYLGLPKPRSVYALDAASGRLIWKAPTELEPSSVPAVARGIVVLATEDLNSPRAHILALDAATGREIWRLESREGVSSPSIASQTVIIGGGDGFAHALDLETGRSIWRSPTEDVFGVKTFPAIAFGDVFLADRVGNLYRLDGRTGKRKWILRDTVGTMDQSFPVIAGSTLFIGSGAGWVYAVDAGSGRVLWKERVGGVVLSGAADSKRFYFGVKLRNEGLYAYAHDPGEPAPPGGAGALLRTSFLLALILAAILLARRRRAARRHAERPKRIIRHHARQQPISLTRRQRAGRKAGPT
ncbi:MAG: PQQ-binding-like beta-propeller repeat protein [Actinomycetota bacterium]